MIYELAHFLKERCSILWNMVELGNSELFSVLHKSKLKNIPTILKRHSKQFIIRETSIMDVEPLVRFFNEQPAEAYTFFNPHGFDEKSVEKVIRNKSFLTYVIADRDSIVGYFFLRSFVNGKCFKGRIVDYRYRNKGIAKQMGNIINDIATHLGLRIFTTISPDNYASLASTNAVNDIKILKTLDNGYYYIECTPKSENQ